MISRYTPSRIVHAWQNAKIPYGKSYEEKGLDLYLKKPGTNLKNKIFAHSALGAVKVARNFVRVGRFVDEIFYSDYKKKEINPPLFILANPRSGTTFLHRLLSLDKKNFQSFKLWETLLPSISMMKGVDTLIGLDKKMGAPFSNLLDSVNNMIFQGWEDIHKTGFQYDEEDVGLMLLTFMSPAMYGLFPFVDELPEIKFLDGMDDRHKRSFLNYYIDAYKKFSYSRELHEDGRMILNKNVFFTGRLKSMLDEFPEAKFVYLVRNPYKAIPSFLNMFYVFWKMHMPNFSKDSPEIKRFAYMLMDYYKYILEHQHLFPEDRFILIKYSDLIVDPGQTIQNIYQGFGIEMTSEFERNIRTETTKAKSYKSKHHYSLEEYGLTKEEIYEYMKDVFDEFGFER